MQEIPSSQLPRADAYTKMYMFDDWETTSYRYYDTNLTEQELSNMWVPQEMIENILSWEWFAIEEEIPT
jgi:hypothetical protein